MTKMFDKMVPAEGEGVGGHNNTGSTRKNPCPKAQKTSTIKKPNHNQELNRNLETI